ncbi:hypothetical protein RHGRI_003818 [Rhododendron griersonianum]|uniref:Uncharacterized protein n=1 Tax=Rhododendron griersonianum TaxID=479676 RepID=A0AAV6L9B3_9ERIC|nr:hypothetical protein RHGRI_003818 [Rhododendron griersonianum]
MMPNASADPLSLRLDEKLTHLSGAHFEWYIYKIHDGLRRQSKKAYEPEILSIGPYHRGKGHLRMMEEHKLQYLRLLLKRTEETSVDRYVAAMRKLRKRAQGCYADSINLSEEQFVEMMLLDSCFIVEFLRKFSLTMLRDTNDPIFKMDWILHGIWRDLILFENQLPFFILVHLFTMTKIPDPRDNMVDLIIRYGYCVREHYICTMSPGFERLLRISYGISLDDMKHFLGVVHHILSSSVVKLVSYRNICHDEKRWDYIHSATELHEAGIRFKKAKRTPLLYIRFVNGVIEIPHFAVEERFETFFRNLIAHEEHLQDAGPKYVKDYLTFLCCLINSARDVSLLRRCGILENMLGDDEAVSAVFSKCSRCVQVSRADFCYYGDFNDINAYCKRRQNIWTTKLRRDYFNSPWKIISFLGVVLLLLLSLAQTTLSGLLISIILLAFQVAARELVETFSTLNH